jgi:outer membrane biosynthesis protein TonB
MAQTMKVVSILAEKYGFNVEEAMASLKKVKSVKSVKKVEVSDIFEDLTRESGVDSGRVECVDKVAVVKEKKPRTEAQLVAFEKMRLKRAEKLAEKLAEKEKEGEGASTDPKDPKEPKAPKEPKKPKEPKAPKEPKKPKEPKEPKEEKEKKPRTEAQLAAFEKMKQAKAEKKEKALKEKENAVVVVEEVSVKKFVHEGVEYLKSSNNTLYNPETEEAVGMWDENTGKMLEMELTEEEEIDE